MQANDRSDERLRMVIEQLEARGITDRAVLSAMGEVAREVFVPAASAPAAYQDSALAIEEGQTISQPYVVALMVQAAELDHDSRVLEVGTGSGYAAAVLGLAAGEVFTVERHATLVERARRRLEGYRNVTVLHADGSLGLPAHAPYDAILVAAAAPELPTVLTDQLAVGGRLVVPIDRRWRRGQVLVRVRRIADDDVEVDELGSVGFVPLVPGSGS